MTNLLAEPVPGAATCYVELSGENHKTLKRERAGDYGERHRTVKTRRIESRHSQSGEVIELDD